MVRNADLFKHLIIIQELKVIKMKEDKRRLSILRIQRMVRRLLKRRGKDLKAR